MNTRGPGTRPALMAFLSDTSAHSLAPTFLTVVKPASSVFLAFFTPTMAAYPGH